MHHIIGLFYSATRLNYPPLHRVDHPASRARFGPDVAKFLHRPLFVFVTGSFSPTTDDTMTLEIKLGRAVQTQYLMLTGWSKATPGLLEVL
jgi:hypothetical protein